MVKEPEIASRGFRSRTREPWLPDWNHRTSHGRHDPAVSEVLFE